FNLIESCFLCGDAELANEYTQKLRVLLDTGKLRHRLVRGLLDDEFFSRALPKDYELTSAIDTKTYLLLLPQWGVRAMAIYYGLEDRNSLARIDSLVKRRIFHPDIGKLLKKLITNAL